jgi:hypothetical protein
MSFSISTLLIRNLNDVFGEIDPARRRAARSAVVYSFMICAGDEITISGLPFIQLNSAANGDHVIS